MNTIVFWNTIEVLYRGITEHHRGISIHYYGTFYQKRTFPLIKNLGVKNIFFLNLNVESYGGHVKL